MANRKPHFVIYTDDAGQYRWRYMAQNGKVIADSGESYRRLTDLKRAIGILKTTIERAEVKEIE